MPENLNPKTILLGYIAVTILFFIGLSAYAKLGPGFPLAVNQITTNKTDLFTVTGEGKVTAVPDTAQISLGFTQSGPTVSQVQSQANSTINSVSSAIKKLGVGDKDIQTSNYNLRPDYDFTSGRQTIKGYVADVSLTVKVRQFDKINQVIDAATANGANQVGGLTFTLDDATQAKLTAQARKIAIDQAKQKAAELASETGLNLGRIVDVQEAAPNQPRPLFMAAENAIGGGAPSVPTKVEAGSSEISVSVTISYETR